MSPRARASVALGVAVLLGACGGGAAEGPGLVATPSGTGSVAMDGGASAASPTTEPAPSGAASVAPAPSFSSTPDAPAATVELKSPVPTAFADDLKALGLDVAKLPPMAKLEPKQLRAVMKIFAKSLGAKCGDCHQEGDFAAQSSRKKIAAKMWDQFAAKLTFSDGSPLFCDSCHQGRIKQLVRTDKKALSKWMGANFVDKLKRKDGQEQACETCHVEWDMTFLKSWAK